MWGTLWARKKYQTGFSDILRIVLKGSCVGVFDDNDHDEESGLCGSNKWPLGSGTFPRDLRHQSLRGTHARARVVYTVKNVRTRSQQGILFLLSQRESFVTVKFLDPEISMIFDISVLPESKYAFSNKMCECAYVRACVCVCVCVCISTLHVSETNQPIFVG